MQIPFIYENILQKFFAQKWFNSWKAASVHSFTYSMYEIYVISLKNILVRIQAMLIFA